MNFPRKHEIEGSQAKLCLSLSSLKQFPCRTGPAASNWSRVNRTTQIGPRRKCLTGHKTVDRLRSVICMLLCIFKIISSFLPFLCFFIALCFGVWRLHIFLYTCFSNTVPSTYIARRPRWSSATVLAIGPKVRWFRPRTVGFLRSIQIRNTISFGG
jgi:hypothetical protein